MKQKIIIAQSITILVLLIALIILVLNPNNITNYLLENKQKENLLYFEYGDEFTGIELTDFDGNTSFALQQSDKFTVAFYLSNSCSSCIKALADFERLSEVFGDDLNYVILWYENIPLSYLEKYSIDISINYSLTQKTKISTSTPTYYILDENNEVVFRDINRANLIEKLIDLELVSPETLIDNANQYIIDHYFDSDSRNDKIVYFYMPGCPDCEEADSLLRSSSLMEQFDFTYIYKYDTTDSSKIIDKDKLFANVYNITWYPSFLVLSDNNYRIIGEVPSDKLISELVK